MSYKGLFALKWWVIVAFLIYWNLGMGIVIYLNQGMGTISNRLACFSGSIFLLITSGSILFFTLNQDLRNILISRKRKHLYDETLFGLIGVICFILSGFFLMYGVALTFIPKT